MTQGYGEWIESEVHLPPQGLKVLCFKEGDIYVGSRWGEHWYSLPFLKELGPSAPDLWSYIDVPTPYTGSLKFKIEGNERLMELDEIEIEEPEFYQEMLNAQKRMYD